MPQADQPDEPPKDLFGHPIQAASKRSRGGAKSKRPLPPSSRTKRRIKWTAIGGLIVSGIWALILLFPGMAKDAAHKLGGSYIEAQARRFFGLESHGVQLVPWGSPIETGSLPVVVPPQVIEPPQQPKAASRKPKKEAEKEKTLLQKLFPIFFDAPGKK